MWVQYNPNPTGRSVDDCSIRAVSKALDIDWETAYIMVCSNGLATCQTQNIVQNEANATRFADANNTRDIIQSQADGTRAILDKLCSLELEAKNDTIAQLRSELLYARGQASQDVQTARILAGQVAETDAIYNRLNECPVGTTPVFGRTPIFQCNGGCGCSGNTFIN